MADYVIFFPRTGAARVFESYNLAQATYPRMDVLAGPESVPASEALIWYEQLFEYLDAEGKHFQHGTTHVTLARDQSQMFPKVRVAEERDALDLRETFWRLATTCGDRVTKYAPNNESVKRGKRKVTGYAIDLVRANAALVDPSIPQMPAQARAIVEFLTEQEFDHYTRDEMIRVCSSVAFLRKIKTRQDPWRIWRYYSPLLHRLGVIR